MGYIPQAAPPEKIHKSVLRKIYSERGRPVVFAMPMVINRRDCSYCGFAGERVGSCPKCGAAE